MIEVMCRIADGPLGPGELEIAQEADPLVSWSVITRELSEEGDWQGKDLAVELGAGHRGDRGGVTHERLADRSAGDQVPNPHRAIDTAGDSHCAAGDVATGHCGDGPRRAGDGGVGCVADPATGRPPWLPW